MNLVQVDGRGPLVPGVFAREKFPRRVLVEVEGITFCLPRYLRWLLPLTIDAAGKGVVLLGPWQRLVFGERDEPGV